MALGKNIKIDQLIPEVKEEKKEVKVKKEKKVVKIKSDENLPKESFSLVITPSRRKKVKKVKVGLEGDLTIVNVLKMKQDIIPVFEDYDYVDFTLNNVENIDSSCIQLLLALKTHYKTKNKEVTVKIDIQKELKNILSNAGFSSLEIN